MANRWLLPATFASLAAAAVSPTLAAGDWDACIGAPTRACVLDLAAADVAGIADTYERAGALAELALARSKAGLKADADKDFAAVAQALRPENDTDPLPDYGLRPIILGQLAANLAEAGRIDEAIRTVDEIKIDNGSATGAFAAIALAEAKAGRMDEAKQTIARVLKDASTYGGFLLYRSVYDAQLAAGLNDDLARTLELERDAALAETPASTATTICSKSPHNRERPAISPQRSRPLPLSRTPRSAGLGRPRSFRRPSRPARLTKR